jgi:pimeloyl-ACP methyl ester carboxylesterase
MTLNSSVLRSAAAIGLALVVAPAQAFSQSISSQPPLWGDLRPGAYAVGFRVIYALDRSRIWDATPDSIRVGDSARPVRISVWYPSDRKRFSGAKPMSEGGYFFRHPPNKYFARLDSLIERADTTPMRDFVFGKSDSLFRRYLSLRSAAVRDGPAVRGRFPLVLYSAGYNNRSHDNSVLAEYLASHGYVVVTVPQVGTRSTRLTLGINPVDLETQSRDLEFALARASELPFVAASRLATVGYSMGGIVALQIALRNPSVKAVVGLDPSYRAPRFVPLVLASPYFNPRALRAPILSLQSGNIAEAGAQDSTVLDSLRFADRYVAQIGKAMHGDFSDFAMLAPLFPVSVQGRTAQDSRESYEAIAQYVLHFLNGTLNGDRSEMGFVSRSSQANGLSAGLVRMQVHSAIRVPSELDFALLASRHGLQRALATFEQSRARYPGVEIIDYATLNRIGYGLLESGRPRDAVDVFRLNTVAHPNSADAFDSLAEGLLTAGDSAAALTAYGQLISTLPRDASLSDAARTELRRVTEQKIADLRRARPQ